MTLTPREFLRPCDGYLGSAEPDSAPRTMLTRDSLDTLVVPGIDSHISSRLGSRIQGESDVTARVGLLEANWSARPRKIFPLKSPSMDDGSEQRAYLYTNEDDASRYGQIGWRSTNGADKSHVLGDEFGTQDASSPYPKGAGGGSGVEPAFKMIPIPYITKGGANASFATGLTRCATELTRRMLGQMARSVIQTDKWTYVGGASPFAWNRRFNDNDADATQTVRIRPWGHQKPLYPPTWDPATAGDKTDATAHERANFTYGDTFYITVFFQFEDGSFSEPYIPRPIVNAGAGLIVLEPSGDSTGDTYTGILLRNIMKGPPGTVARILARTDKIPEEDASGTSELRLGIGRAFKPFAKMDNNDETTYFMTEGDDIALRENAIALRPGHLWAPAHRYAEEIDSRIVVGGASRLSPCAIIVAPTGISAERDLNFRDDESGLYGAEDGVAFTIEITGLAAGVEGQVNNLTLRYFTTTPHATGAVTTKQIGSEASADWATLQDVVDGINNTLFNFDNAKQWAAQLVPGMDGNISADFLARTHMTATTVDLTNGSPNLGGSATSSAFKDVAVGMKVIGTDIPADTYIITKTDDDNLVMSNNATGDQTDITVTFLNDTGDTHLLTAGTQGIIRAFGGSFPVVLPLTGDFYMNEWSEQNDHRFYFTTASPTTQPLAADSFYNNNARQISADAGIVMGFAPLEDGGVVWGSKRKRRFMNRNNSNRDEDYQHYSMSDSRGLIAWDTNIHGDGWVGGLTADGFEITDDEGQSIIISRPLWRRGDDVAQTHSNLGVLSYEVQQCVLAAARDDESLDHCHAMVDGDRIHLTYRASSGVTYPDRRLVYDFGESIEASGVREMITGRGLHPWSAPLQQRVSVLGTAEGRVFGAVEDNAGSTGDGRIDRIEFGGYDEIEHTAVCSFSNGVTTVTPDSGDFNDMLVNSPVRGTGMPASATIASIAADGSSLELSGNTTSAGSGVTLTFYRKRISTLAYLAMDRLDSAQQKISAHRLAIDYEQTAITGEIRVSRDRARAGSQTMTLPVSATKTTKRQPIPLASRTPGEIVEYAIVLRTDPSSAAKGRAWFVEAQHEALRTVA